LLKGIKERDPPLKHLSLI